MIYDLMKTSLKKLQYYVLFQAEKSITYVQFVLADWDLSLYYLKWTSLDGWYLGSNMASYQKFILNCSCCTIEAQDINTKNVRKLLMNLEKCQLQSETNT